MAVIAIRDFDQWRRVARRLLKDDAPPERVAFASANSKQSLFDLTDDESEAGDSNRELPAAGRSSRPPREANAAQVPKAFLELAENVACHRAEEKWNLLYRVLWRITHGERKLLDVVTDDDVYKLRRMEKAVTRDSHKAKAFVRFRKVVDEGGERYVAWHRPDHRILRRVAPFFSRRFPSMRWAILTPDESVWWDRDELHFGPGAPASAAPDEDALEDLWRTYYGAIFNPARIKLDAMRKEMPVRHWPTLPETRIIPELLADAPRRVAEMLAANAGLARSAADFLPEKRDLVSLAEAAKGCRGCSLCQRATQTVFGRGPSDARIVLVGEQPGDQEDLAGEPFVGPAGQVLNGALEAAGLSREALYLTNAVKHFHWLPRGERRLHSKPPAAAIGACLPWLEAELRATSPAVVVCLGTTAAQAIVGRDGRTLARRGEILPSRLCEKTLLTWHPSAILRGRDEDSRERMRAELAEHLRIARDAAR